MNEPTIVNALVALADDEELPERARALLHVVLFHGAVRVELIELDALRALWIVAADLRLGTGHVADVERVAEVILRRACPSLVTEDEEPVPRSREDESGWAFAR